MRKLKIYTHIYILLLFLAGSACLMIPFRDLAFAQEKIKEEELTFNQSATYDIYYVTSRLEEFCIKGVKILGTVQIGGRVFLVIKSIYLPVGQSSIVNAGAENKGYILFDSIKAILPSGMVEPVKVGKK